MDETATQSLVDRLGELCARIQAQDEHAALAALNEDLKSAADDVEHLKRGIAEAAQQFAYATVVATDRDGTDAWAQVMAHATTLRESLQAAPADEKPGENERAAQRAKEDRKVGSRKKQLERLTGSIAAAWQAAAQRALANDRGLLALVMEVPNWNDLQEDARQLASLVEYATQTAPQTAEDVRDFKKMRTRCEKIAKAVEDRFEKPERRQLLELIRAGTATVDNIDPATLKWLKDIGIAERITLRIRAPSTPVAPPTPPSSHFTRGRRFR
jgi:hypothetical protein